MHKNKKKKLTKKEKREKKRLKQLKYQEAFKKMQKKLEQGKLDSTEINVDIVN